MPSSPLPRCIPPTHPLIHQHSETLKQIAMEQTATHRVPAALVDHAVPRVVLVTEAAALQHVVRDGAQDALQPRQQGGEGLVL